MPNISIAIQKGGSGKTTTINLAVALHRQDKTILPNIFITNFLTAIHFIMNSKSGFSREIYTEALDWYKSAEKKAEILLSFLGAFIVFVSGFILASPKDIGSVISKFNLLTWVCLALTFTSMFYGLYSAYQCLRSRIGPVKKKKANTDELFYPADNMYFFQHHSDHEPNKLFESLKQVDEEKEIAIYSSEIIALSKNVVQKHKWINRGFIAVCCSILLMFLSTLIYITGFI